MTRELAGFGLLALAALLFSTLGPLARAAYEGGGTPVDLLVIRYGVAAAVLWPLLAARRAPLRRPAGQLGRLLALGGVYAASALGVFLALQHLPVGLTILLFYTYPAWVTLFSWLLGEAVGPRRLAALALALAGLALIVGFHGADADWRWIGAALAGAALVAVFVVASDRLMRGCPSAVLLAYVLATSALAYAAAGWASGTHLHLSAVGWAAAIGIGLCPTAAALSALLAGVARMGAGRAALVGTLEPLLATLWGALLLGERLGEPQLLGGALVLAALVLGARRERSPAHRGPRQEPTTS